MTKIKILGTGLSGMVGSRIVELLKNKYDFEEISRSTGIDILDREKVWEKIKNSVAEIIFHLAAYTNVDLAETQKNLADDSEVWKINVEGTKNIAAAAKEFGKKLIYISTDMVFSGDQDLQSKYLENDIVVPQNFYAVTKYVGEKIVKKLQDFLILRIAYPFGAKFDLKRDYVKIFKTLLEQNKNISAVSDHFFTPTFIDDLALALDLLIEKKQIGVFHITGEESVSPFIIANLIAEKFNLNKNLITETTREKYFKNKAVRGFNLSLNSDKIKKLGMIPHSFKEELREVKDVF